MGDWEGDGDAVDDKLRGWLLQLTNEERVGRGLEESAGRSGIEETGKLVILFDREKQELIRNHEMNHDEKHE
jgi:hypothetical protein